jgi:hypothetical protein
LNFLLPIITSNDIANWVRNKVSGENISDAGCTYRVFKRECIAHVKFFNGGHRFLPALIRMEGFRVVEVSVSTNPRLSGTSHCGVWNWLFKSFRDLLAVRWIKSRQIRYEIAESNDWNIYRIHGKSSSVRSASPLSRGED